MKTFKQLDIYWVDLEPTKGAETQKRRPCVIVQADWLNTNSATLLVAPLLPAHKAWPFAVNIVPSKQNKVDKNRHLNLKQLRAVDISRLSNLHGKLEQSYLKSINAALTIVFDLDR